MANRKNTATRKKQTRTRSSRREATIKKTAGKSTTAKPKARTAKSASKKSAKNTATTTKIRKSAGSKASTKSQKASLTTRNKSNPAKSPVKALSPKSKHSRKQEQQKLPWIGGVRSDHIPGYRIAKRFDTIEWKTRDLPSEFSTNHEWDEIKSELCRSPGELMERLRRIAEKCGANGLLHFFYRRRRFNFAIKTCLVEISSSEYNGLVTPFGGPADFKKDFTVRYSSRLKDEHGCRYKQQGRKYYQIEVISHFFREDEEKKTQISRKEYESIYQEEYSATIRHNEFLRGICKKNGKLYRIQSKNVTQSIEYFNGSATPVVFEPIRKIQRDNRSQENYAPNKNLSFGPTKEQVRVNSPKHCVIDGSNLIRDKDHGGSVETFAACFFAVKENGCQVQVFLDANEFHNLSDNGDSKGMKLLTKLIKEYPDNIQLVPAGSRADDYVLLDASNNSGHVISNDRYLEYTERYPWLKNGGRRHTFMVTNGHLQIPNLGIDVIVGQERMGGV